MGPPTALLLTHLVAALMAALPGAADQPANTSNPVEDRWFKDTASKLDAWTPCSGVSPWELMDLEDSDLMTPVTGMKMVITNEKLKWPNKTVPYVIEKSDFTREEIMQIRGAILDVNKLSCVKFLEATSTAKDFVRITGKKKEGCISEGWGTKGGAQKLNLEPPNCIHRGTIYHELFHALGFWHMHNAPHRDQFIRVIEENVEKDRMHHFTKYKNDGSLTDFRLRYDYNSIMHFSRRAYSKNGKDTIETHDPTANIGLKRKPSHVDIAKLKFLYECDPEPVYEPQTKPTPKPKG